MNDLKRIYPNGKQVTKIYKKMAVEHRRLPYNRTEILKDLKTSKIIRVDELCIAETVKKVIYDEPFIKVILQFDGKNFIGQSKCSKEDIFSTQTGYDIARSRAEIKRLNYFISKISKLGGSIDE